MNYIAIGILGFLMAFLFDVISLRGISRIKPFIWVTAIVLIVFAHLMVSLESGCWHLPAWVNLMGWILLPVSIFLFLYSLFINLPFRKTYMAQGTGNELIKCGTYALVRHPGVLCYALVLVSLILVSESSLLLIASPLWLGIDVLHVVVQDKYLFGKMFKDYNDYQKETPMLIPNRKSVVLCIKTLMHPEIQYEIQERSQLQ